MSLLINESMDFVSNNWHSITSKGINDNWFHETELYNFLVKDFTVKDWNLCVSDLTVREIRRISNRQLVELVLDFFSKEAKYLAVNGSINFPVHSLATEDMTKMVISQSVAYFDMVTVRRDIFTYINKLYGTVIYG